MSRFGVIVPVSVLCLLLGCSLPRWRGLTASDFVAARQISQQATRALYAGRASEASKAFEAAVRRCPHDPQIRERFGDFLRTQGRDQEALEQFLAASQLAVDDPHPRLKAAEVAYQKGQFQLAEQLVGEAIKLQPQLPKAWLLFARVLASSRRWEEAVTAYMRAIALAPEDPDAHIELAKIYRQLGDPYKALVTLQALGHTYLPNESPQQLLMELAVTYQQMGRVQEAEEVLIAAKKRDPKNPAYDRLMADIAAVRASTSVGGGPSEITAPPRSIAHAGTVIPFAPTGDAPHLTSHLR